MKVQELLTQHKIPFEIVQHRPGESLLNLASAGKLRPSELAKVTLLRADHGYRYMLAVASPERSLDLHSAMRALEGCELERASDTEQTQFCPDCETGHLMPFGSHYNVRTLLDERLLEEGTIAFEEVDGSEAIRMKTADFCGLEHPFVIPLTRASREHASR